MCVFCDLENMRRLLIIETDFTWVISNIHPINALGHFLLVPKAHVTKLTELTDEQREDVFNLLFAVTSRIEERVGPEGLNIQVNQGTIAGQTILHFHIHVICRSKGDGIVNMHKDGDRPEIDEKTVLDLKRLLK